MVRAKVTFDIDRVQIQARSNLPSCLRMLADSIESGEIDVRVLRCVPHGMAHLRDPRAHVLFEMDIAAEIQKMIQVPEDLGTGDRKELV